MSSTATILPPPAAGAPSREERTRTAEVSRSLLTSSVGKKMVMAVTGIVLYGFVIIHMIGNLQVYLGPEAMNHYAVFLRALFHGWALWIFRGVLLASVLLHIWAATLLTLENWRARPVGYRKRRMITADYASRTMVWSGPIIALFVIYHVLHFTTGTIHPGFTFIEGDVYHNFIGGFLVLPVSLFYIFAMLALGFHLWHGVWSMLQTLGLAHPRYNGLRHGLATVTTVLVVGGNISFPVAVLAGWLR